VGETRQNTGELSGWTFVAISQARAATFSRVYDSGHDVGKENPMSVRSGSRRGRKVWVVQVCRNGQNLRRYLDKREYLKSEAKELEAKIVARFEKGVGECSNPVGGGGFSEEPLSFRGFASQYLELQDASRPDFRNKRRDLERHLVPFFDATPLNSISRLHIDRLRAHLRSKPSSRHKRKPLSPKTINNILGTLKAMLNIALEYELLDRVPVIRMEKVPKKDPGFLTEKEVTDLLEGTDPEWRALVGVAVYAGLRRGELIELRWGDIHLKDWHCPFIRVQRAINIDGGVYRVKETKGNSMRSVPVCAELHELLLAHRPTNCRPDDLVFVEAPARTPSGHLRERVIWEAVDKAAQVGRVRKHIHPHLLRHTFASLALQRGVPLSVVQRWLGHANISTTERYAHLATRTGDNYVDRLNFVGNHKSEMAQDCPGGQTQMHPEKSSAVTTAVTKIEERRLK